MSPLYYEKRLSAVQNHGGYFDDDGLPLSNQFKTQVTSRGGLTRDPACEIVLEPPWGPALHR